MKKLIIWQKFVTPMCDDYKINEMLENLEEMEDEEEEEGFIKETKDKLPPIKNLHIIRTHLGLIALKPNAFLENNFKFWIIHTNFFLNRGIVQQICDIQGIETLNVFTRYRAMLSVGQAFDFQSVRRYMDSVLTCDTNNQFYEILPFNEKERKSMQQKVATTKKDLNITSPFWAVLKTPDGKTRVEMSEDVSMEFQSKLNDMEEIAAGTDCELLTYLDE